MVVKVRGKEYLCINYGFDYDFFEYLVWLKCCGFGCKWGFVICEFSFGLEVFSCFVCYEFLFWVYECVFGVFVFEMELVDLCF